MAQAVVRGGFDTYAGSINPSREHGDDKFLRLLSGQQYAFVYLKNPAPRGATIVSATLRVRARGASTGARTLTVRRIAESWKAARLNWNNKPSVIGTGKTATIGAVADGDVIEFDVTQHVQTVVNGSAHYGWRIETDATTMHKLYGFDAGSHKPTLTVQWSEKPDAPTSLEPSGGAVSVAKPVLQFDYSDITGDDLVAVQVQVDPAANGSSPGFDSGEVASTEPELDLSATAYAGLAGGATTQWRARVKDSGGLWSNWSDWVSFSRDVKGTLTITNPAASPNNVVWEPTPPIIWSLTGETQAAYQVRVTKGDDRTHILYDSGKVKGADTSLTLPRRDDRGRRLIVDDETYQVNVRVWDGKDRVGTPGDPVFTYAWQTFTMNDDAGVTAPDSLVASNDGVTPWVDLTWSRATAPDSFVVRRNGKRIAAQLDPADLLTGGVYVWRDVEARPFDQHTYTVKAVVNGRQSQPSNTSKVTPKPTGLWVIDADRDLSFTLSGLDVENWRHTDQGVTYQPLGSPVSVRIVQGMNGLEGSFRGTLSPIRSRSIASMEADLWKIKERPTSTVQLIAADYSIPVKLDNLSCIPHPDATPERLLKLVTFNFRQVGDLPFDARI